MSVLLASGLGDFLRDAVDLQVQVDAIGLGAVFALMAVGIGLVFGVMRLVNFAYGQLIMAGAFALAYASDRDWPVGVGIALCFAVVLALSLAMERVVFRPITAISSSMKAGSRSSQKRRRYLSSGWKKLGHPLPDSNLVSDENNG